MTVFLSVPFFSHTHVAPLLRSKKHPIVYSLTALEATKGTISIHPVNVHVLDPTFGFVKQVSRFLAQATVRLSKW